MQRVLKYTERFYSHNYEFEAFDPPLRVVGAVASRWGPGDHFYNKKKQTFSINVVTYGNGVFNQESRTGTVLPGEAFLAHQGHEQLFSTGSAGYMHKRSILIEGRALDMLMQTTGLIDRDHVKPMDPALAIGLVRQAYRLLRDKPAGFTTALSSCAYDLLLELARSIAPEYPGDLHAAVEFVKRNLHRSCALDQIARAARMSTRQCNRLFHQHLNQSPVAFFIDQKMAVAASMVRNTSLPFKQIAAQLGYEDQFHFSMQFKKHFGMSPRKYRGKPVIGNRRSVAKTEVRSRRSEVEKTVTGVQ
jgi:AraC-like DNA-binding protein